MVPVETIKECKAFKVFPEPLIQEMADIGVELAYKANEMLFNIDEPADNLAVLIKGRVDILTTKRTQLVPVQTLHPGDPFALSSLITGRFTGAAKAMEDSVICALPVYRMNKILEKDYKAAYLFMKHIALLVAGRLVRMHYQLDITGSGFA